MEERTRVGGTQLELVHRQFGGDDGVPTYRSHDLNPNAMCTIVVDGIHTAKDRYIQSESRTRNLWIPRAEA